jgi:hypothetical protein
MRPGLRDRLRIGFAVAIAASILGACNAGSASQSNAPHTGNSAAATRCVEDLGSGQTVTFDGIGAEQGCVDLENLSKQSPALGNFRRVDANFPQPPIVECRATENQLTATWRMTTPLSTNGKPPPTAEEWTAECAFLFLNGPNPHPQVTP